MKEDKFKRHIYILTVRGLENSKMFIETSVVYTGAISVGCQNFYKVKCFVYLGTRVCYDGDRGENRDSEQMLFWLNEAP